MGDQEYNSGKKYRQKGTLCGPNNLILWHIMVVHGRQIDKGRMQSKAMQNSQLV
jgi:hypothetical protein